MNIIIWLVAGGILGWIGYSALRLNDAIGRMPAVILGGVAAVLGGKEIAPLFNAVALVPGGFNPTALVIALATASVVLVAAHMIQVRWA